MLVLSKEVVSLLEEVVPVPETYPSFEVPVTNQTLAALYKELNSSYFGGDLPEARVRLVPLAKNFFAR